MTQKTQVLHDVKGVVWQEEGKYVRQCNMRLVASQGGMALGIGLGMTPDGWPVTPRGQYSLS